MRTQYCAYHCCMLRSCAMLCSGTALRAAAAVRAPTSDIGDNVSWFILRPCCPGPAEDRAAVSAACRRSCGHMWSDTSPASFEQAPCAASRQQLDVHELSWLFDDSRSVRKLSRAIACMVWANSFTCVRVSNCQALQPSVLAAHFCMLANTGLRCSF